LRGNFTFFLKHFRIAVKDTGKLEVVVAGVNPNLHIVLPVFCPAYHLADPLHIKVIKLHVTAAFNAEVFLHVGILGNILPDPVIIVQLIHDAPLQLVGGLAVNLQRLVNVAAVERNGKVDSQHRDRNNKNREIKKHQLFPQFELLFRFRHRTIIPFAAGRNSHVPQTTYDRRIFYTLFIKYHSTS